MNPYANIQGVNSFLSLIIVIFIALKKNRKPIDVTYSLWLVCFAVWTFSYFMWATVNEIKTALIWLDILMYAVCFIHMTHFHFMLTFSRTTSAHKKALTFGYILSICMCLLNYHGLFMDPKKIRPINGFLYWPWHGPYLWLFIVIQISYVLFSFGVLMGAIKTSDEPLKNRLKLFLIASAMAWIGGLINWLPYYIYNPIPPVGNFVVTLYLFATFYLIFKHDVLGLNIVVKKTFTYALLSLFITLTYTLFIIVSERFFQAFVGYKSFIVTALAAMTIAAMFNPLRSFLVKIIDKFFFGKNIVELSTENLQMRSELQKADQMKSVATLAAGMAHEIKNPLTAIKTFTEYLPSKANDSEFINQFTNIVGSEVAKIDKIVHQLLEFSRPSPPKLEKTNLAEIIDDTLQLLEAEFVKHKIDVIKKFDEDATWIKGDKKQLQQVFLNLFLNSIQAMPDSGTLTTSVQSEPNGMVKVSTSDTGHGISEENLPHIFDPFFTTKATGTGLGLAISHGILKEHCCKLSVESRQGHGTTFTMKFLAE